VADPGIVDPEALLRFWFGDEAKSRGSTRPPSSTIGCAKTT
jgi:hypothetical protein